MQEKIEKVAFHVLVFFKICPPTFSIPGENEVYAGFLQVFGLLVYSLPIPLKLTFLS